MVDWMMEDTRGTFVRTTSFPKAKSLAKFSMAMIACCTVLVASFIPPHEKEKEAFHHIRPPKHVRKVPSNQSDDFFSNFTLREFLLDEQGVHLAMAPSFFGFYGYYGMLAAWEEATASPEFDLLKSNIKSLAGASAGAMAAVLLSMGVSPRDAADFSGTVTLENFADFPGLLSAFKGNKFEQIMHNYLKSQRPGINLRLENSNIPVAVTGFDIQTMSTKILKSGSCARAARASATFPGLFQPVHWIEKNGSDALLIDGGILDHSGLVGLSAIPPLDAPKRVINMVVGSFGSGVPPGPSSMPVGLNASEVVSISITNLPQCGPWAMENGPRAVQAAYRAMLAAIDLPLYKGQEPGHYEIHMDGKAFIDDASKIL